MNISDMKFGSQDDTSIFSDTMVEMNWQEVAKASDAQSIVLLPLGIIEAHGPHMDLSPDIKLSHLYCRFLKQALHAQNIPSIIAPPMYWGHALDTARYPGTFSVRPETMKALLLDMYRSLESWGFSNVFLINCHGDQTHVKMMDESIAEADATLKITVIDLGKLDLQVADPPSFPAPREGRFDPDYHAGAMETAQMNTFFPSVVNTAKAKELLPSDSFHPLAYCGDPASYDRENHIVEYYKADLEMDVKKLQLFLSVSRQR